MSVTGRGVSPEAFAEQANVPRETLARLKAYVGLLQDWNARHNLVSSASIEDVWRRHIWDSAQLVRYVPPTAQTLIDLGSGAGFPGMVLAELLRGRVHVTLFEATAKKCSFLEAVRDRLSLDVVIRNGRMEEAAEDRFDVVTARACAPLDKLLAYAQKFLGEGSIGLFLKGQNLGVELTDAHKSWKMGILQHPSLTDPSGAVLEVRELRHVADQASKGARRRQPKGRRR
jgi:16S rRNA (guanine527-N7)-methyltransferase